MIAFARVAILLAAAAANQGAQAIRLDPGEYRWWPIRLRQTPAQVDCRYEVLNGRPTVHVELLSMREFHAFAHSGDYEKLAATPDAMNGYFSRIVPDRGEYAVVVMNEKNAPPAIVSLNVQTNVNPNGPGIAKTLPPGRRLVVILISFAIFFISLAWSGYRLIHAMKSSR